MLSVIGVQPNSGYKTSMFWLNILALSPTADGGKGMAVTSQILFWAEQVGKQGPLTAAA
jgi:hypothetical protein